MSSNSAGTLVPLMVASLPQPPADGSDATPALRSPWDTLALLCHVCLLSVDFRLVGLGEDEKTEAESDATTPKPLPTSWNDSRSSDFAFRYKHPQSQLEYLLKVGRLGGKAVISGLGLGDDRVRSFDVTVRDYVSESSLPFALPATNSTETSDADGSVKQALTNIFISHGRIADFSALFKVRIIQALVPGLQKPGYEEASESSSSAVRDGDARTESNADARRNEGRHPPPSQDPLPPLAQPRPPLGMPDPLAMPPRRPGFGEQPPGFEDEHQILSPPRGYPPGGWGGPGLPASGQRDLYPPGLGPGDPLRVGPGGRPGGGGMYPSRDDPMFGGLGEERGFDPQAPPGARYDPVFPGDPRGNARFPRGPGGGGFGGPANPFGGFQDGDFI